MDTYEEIEERTADKDSDVGLEIIENEDQDRFIEGDDRIE